MSSKHLVNAALIALAGSACGSARPTGRPNSASIAGKWRSDCFAANAQQGATTSYDLGETTWSIDYVLFEDRACTQKFLTIHVDGAYSIDAPSAIVPGAYESRFEFATKTITPHVPAAASFLETADGCGRTGFASGVTTNISTDGCAGLLLPAIATCRSDYDLVARVGDELRFGMRPEDNNMCTAARRPTSLEPVVNRRQSRDS